MVLYTCILYLAIVFTHLLFVYNFTYYTFSNSVLKKTLSLPFLRKKSFYHNVCLVPCFVSLSVYSIFKKRLFNIINMQVVLSRDILTQLPSSGKFIFHDFYKYFRPVKYEHMYFKDDIYQRFHPRMVIYCNVAKYTGKRRNLLRNYSIMLSKSFWLIFLSWLLGWRAPPHGK